MSPGGDKPESTVQRAVDNAYYITDDEGNRVKPSADDLHVGLASIDVGTGGILALYGGSDFVSNSRNWATTPRYAASTFKVWGAVAGLRNGFGLSSTLRGSTYTPEGDTEPVQNDSAYNYGTVTLQKAIQDSINTSFVDLIARIPNGTEELIRAANDAGIPEDDSWAPQVNRMVLGEGEVTALDNATGYATLAGNGVRNETHIVAEVRDASGNVVYSGNSEGVQAIETPVAQDLSYALSGAVAGSTVSAVDGRDVAGKTGTEGIAVGQDGATKQITRSAWLCGYTKQIATAVVMVAGDDGNQNLDVYARPGSGAFYGAGYPTDVWNSYMAVATDGLPFVDFDPPANIQPTVRNTLPVTSATSAAPQPTETTEPEETSAPETTRPVETTETTEPGRPETTAPETTEAPEPEEPTRTGRPG